MKSTKVTKKTVADLKWVDKLFYELNNNKTLPTFIEHFMLCIVLKTSEKVNLKTMYPETHKELETAYKKHISKMRNAKSKSG